MNDPFREKIADAVESGIRTAFEFSTPVEPGDWRKEAETIADAVMAVLDSEDVGTGR